MTHRLGEKSVACLEYIERMRERRDHGDPLLAHAEWREDYDRLCERFGEKVVLTKLDSLADRGFIDYGVSARMGWLTEKGEAALAELRATFSG